MIPPDTEAERRVIGAMLFGLSQEDQASVLQMLSHEDFEATNHWKIWMAIEKAVGRGNPVDEVTVKAELGNGGVSLTDLCAYTEAIPSTANAMAWARVVKQRSLARKALAALKVQAEALVASPDSPECLQNAVAAVSELQVSATNARPSWGNLVASTATELQAKASGKSPAITTGIPSLDRVLNGGARPAQMFVVAGRPGTGKSAFATQMAWKNARAGKSVWFASFEMMPQEIIERIIATETRIPSDRVHSGRLTDADWPYVADALGRIQQRPNLYIHEYGAASIENVRADALRHRASHGLDLVVIDYLQLVKGRGGNRYEEVSDVSRCIKHLAQDLAVPVLALAQLRRPQAGQESKAPSMSELRDSGQIEQDAHAILLLHKSSDDEIMVECNVAKQRGGPTPRLDVVFNKPLYEFTDA